MKDYVKEACSKACKERLVSLLDLSSEVLSYIEDKVFEPVEGYKFKFHGALKLNFPAEDNSSEKTEALEMINYLNSFKNCKAQAQYGLQFYLEPGSDVKFGIIEIEIMVW